MTGNIKCRCPECHAEFWVTWGYGGPKEFVAREEQRCYVCREEILPDRMEPEMQSVEKKEPEAGQVSSEPKNEEDAEAGAEELLDYWDGAPGC